MRISVELIAMEIDICDVVATAGGDLVSQKKKHIRKRSRARPELLIIIMCTSVRQVKIYTDVELVPIES